MLDDRPEYRGFYGSDLTNGGENMHKKRTMTGLSLALIIVFVFGLTIALSTFALAGQTIRFAVAGPMTGDSAAIYLTGKHSTLSDSIRA